VRAGREDAIMSKKLATIITDVPVEFHEEDFRLKEWNNDALRDVFNELEFRTVVRRLLGDDSPQPARPGSAGTQGQLFDGAGDSTASFQNGNGEGDASFKAIDGPVPGKNISNVPHDYELVESEGEFASLTGSAFPNG
jgi:DNA polymerase-1